MGCGYVLGIKETETSQGLDKEGEENKAVKDGSQVFGQCNCVTGSAIN